MSKETNRAVAEDQPGLEVVVPVHVVDETSLPEANYIENEASPPPQQVQVNNNNNNNNNDNTHSPSQYRPSSHYGITPNNTASFAHGKELDTNANLHDKIELDTATTTTSPFTTTPRATTTIYSPTSRNITLNYNNDLEAVGNNILAAGAGLGENNQIEEKNKKKIPLWRRKKFWIIIGIIAAVLLVVGGVVGGVLGSQE